MPYKKDQEKVKELALERIKRLFETASDAGSDKNLTKRYVTMARKIAMKSNLRLPSSLKRKFCRKCNSFFVIGKNCRVRTREGKLIYYCLECKKFTRIQLKKKKISAS